MTKNYVVVDPSDEDGGYLKDRPGEVSGAIFDYFKPVSWSQERLGKDYAKRFYPKAGMSAYINKLFDPPCVDIGIDFDDFSIPEDANSADESHELLSLLMNISDRRAFYAEIHIHHEDEQHSWYDVRVDDSYLARFIPLLRADDETVLFHAPHLYQLLEHLFSTEGIAPFFAMPHGPSANLLHLARFF
jgi:hypothetical protein